MLTSSRWLTTLAVAGSLGIATLASAADGVIYIEDLKSLDRASLKAPVLRTGRPQGTRPVPVARPEMTKKESFFSKLTPSWLRGEKKEATRSQSTASRMPSRFDSAVIPAAHLAQQSQIKRAQPKRSAPRAGGIAMRPNAKRVGLLDGWVGTQPKAKSSPARKAPVRKAQPFASRQPARSPSIHTRSNRLANQPATSPLAAKRPAPRPASRHDLPKVVASPAIMAMTQAPRTPQVHLPEPLELPQSLEIATDEVVALERKPQRFDDMVFATDAPAVEPEVTEAPRPLAMPKAPRELMRPAMIKTTPQKLAVVAYPAAKIKAPQNDRSPTERAQTLLAEAHALAASATTAEEYSAIIQRCRYVLAIDDSSQAIAYANELASWALNKRGEGFVNEGRLAEAETDFLEALRSNDTCWRAEHNLAVLEAQREDYESARRRFSRTIELNPEYAKAYCNRAAISTQSGDFSSAMGDYERAIEANPDLSIAHIGRGRVCHMLGHLEQALRHFDAAELLQPQDATIVIARGDLLVDLGRYGHAKAAYERAIALDPSHPTAYRNLAWMQATCPISEFRDGEAALANATRGAELAGEEDDIALDTRAAALAATGQFEQAAELQKQAIEIAPESDAEVYRTRLSMYEQGEVFTSQPIGGVQQTTFTR